MGLPKNGVPLKTVVVSPFIMAMNRGMLSRTMVMEPTAHGRYLEVRSMEFQGELPNQAVPAVARVRLQRLER